MQHDSHLSLTGRERSDLQRRFTLAHAVVTVAAVLITEGMIQGIIMLTSQESESALAARGSHLALVATGAALVGLLLGGWISRRITRRLQRALDISGAWLRGNLSLRISDRSSDDIGLLAEQLDLLVEKLEQDEEDLEELAERNARLTDQVRTLAVVEERNRLARELHDSVKQHLFSLAMTTSAIRTHLDVLQSKSVPVSSELIEMAHEIEVAAQTAQRETTRLIQDLALGSLQDKGLVEALNDYTLLFGAREHLLTYLEVQGDDGLLSPSIAETLYRVTQEALQNVARHALATRADVHLRCLPEQAVLTIRDNGVGFDTGQTHQGLGLTNMHERMMDLGGRLAVESQPGTGTTVVGEVRLPGAPGAPAGEADLDHSYPSPRVENWAWLGQRLVIPVGQTWPWLPADQAHLHRSLVEPTQEPLLLKESSGFLGLGDGYVLQRGQNGPPIVRVNAGRSGFEWECDRASWALRHVRGVGGRMILTRNGQPLAAVQYQGRLLDTWSEIIYNGHGYRFSYAKDGDRELLGDHVLEDEAGKVLLLIESGDRPQITVRRALPLPLVVIVTMRSVSEDEMAQRRR